MIRSAGMNLRREEKHSMKLVYPAIFYPCEDDCPGFCR
jgi:hypothetical protein